MRRVYTTTVAKTLRAMWLFLNTKYRKDQINHPQQWYKWDHDGLEVLDGMKDTALAFWNPKQ